MSAEISIPKLPPIVREVPHQKKIETHGVIVRYLLTGEDTQGKFSMLDYFAPAGAPVPALHRHDRGTTSPPSAHRPD